MYSTGMSALMARLAGDHSRGSRDLRDNVLESRAVVLDIWIYIARYLETYLPSYKPLSFLRYAKYAWTCLVVWSTVGFQHLGRLVSSRSVLQNDAKVSPLGSG